MKTPVSAVYCDEYRLDKVKKSILKALEPIGRIHKFIQPGKKVLLKPNCLTDTDPGKAVTTHPVFLNAVIDIVKECGVSVYVGDSPALKPLHRVLIKTGMYDVIKKTGVRVLEFRKSQLLRPHPSDTFRQMELPREIEDDFTIINLPKFKTHVYMQLTLSIKNIFGCIVGPRKSQWHFRCGSDTKAFARMLVDNYRHISPSLTLLDGIIGMDGDGPVNGRVRHFDIIMASPDGVALDRVASYLAGFGKHEYEIVNVAREKGIGETSLEKINFIGGNLEDFKFNDFKKAQTVIQDSMPFIFIPASIMKSLFTARPMQDRSKCILCGECVKICPVKAIKIEGKTLRFNYKKCIRCFCCHEICQNDAIEIYKNWLYRTLGFMR